MASKKRGRAALTADDVQTSKAVLPHFYPALPLEIRQLIVEMACLSPSTTNASRSPFPNDVATIVSLCLVCKETHIQATSLLWQTISIPRPSALFAFYQALQLRPERASRVLSLHIGPQDILPSYWWPLSSVEYYKGSRTPLTPSEAGSPYRSIASSLGHEQLPIGCTNRQAWLWDRCPSPCREAAVYEALDVVQKSLNVTLRHEVARPTKIESVFEAQAALDIYLDRLRHIEKSDPELLRLNQPGARVPLRCRNGKGEHYPALHLIDVPSSVIRPDTAPAVQSSTPPAEPPDNAFIVPHSQLLRHLARPGALTDRFDHPLLLARSGFTICITQSTLKGPTKLIPSNASYSLESRTWSIEREHETHKWQRGLDSLHNAPQHFTGTGDVGDLNAALLATGNVGAMLGLARSVLDLLPNLANLSLTGLLQEALGDGPPPFRLHDLPDDKLPSLRNVSIGPALPCWAAPLPLTRVLHVEELRICGSPLPINEAWAITSRMPNLKVLTWSLANEFQNIRGKGIIEVTYVLVAGEHKMTEPNEPDSSSSGSSQDSSRAIDGVIYPASPSQPSSSENDSQDSSISSPDAAPTRHIIVYFHPSDVKKILEAAASPEVQQMWLEGRGTSSAGRRFWLRESEAGKAAAAVGEARPSRNSHSVVWEKLHEEGREYWAGDEGGGGGG